MVISFISYKAYKRTAIFIVMVGMGLRYWINRRAFNRRTFWGSQLFSSYEDANITRFWEELVRIISTLFVAIGILLYLLMWLTESKKKKTDKKNVTLISFKEAKGALSTTNI